MSILSPASCFWIEECVIRLGKLVRDADVLEKEVLAINHYVIILQGLMCRLNVLEQLVRSLWSPRRFSSQDNGPGQIINKSVGDR
jgi:hypothetical protein